MKKIKIPLIILLFLFLSLTGCQGKSSPSLLDQRYRGILPPLVWEELSSYRADIPSVEAYDAANRNLDIESSMFALDAGFQPDGTIKETQYGSEVDMSTTDPTGKWMLLDDQTIAQCSKTGGSVENYVNHRFIYNGIPFDMLIFNGNDGVKRAGVVVKDFSSAGEFHEAETTKESLIGAWAAMGGSVVEFGSNGNYTWSLGSDRLPASEPRTWIIYNGMLSYKSIVPVKNEDGTISNLESIQPSGATLYVSDRGMMCLSALGAPGSESFVADFAIWRFRGEP